MSVYVEKEIQKKLFENPQYDDTDTASLLAPTDKNLGSKQQLDEMPLTATRSIGAQPTDNNRAVGSVRKTDAGSEKTENRDICSQGNANGDIRGPGNTATEIGYGKDRALSSSIGELFRSRPALKMSQKILD